MKYFFALLVVILSELSFVDLVYSQSRCEPGQPLASDSGTPLSSRELVTKDDVVAVNKFIQCVKTDKRQFDPMSLKYNPQFRHYEDVSATSKSEQFESFYNALHNSVLNSSREGHSTGSYMDYISTKTSTCFGDFMLNQEKWVRQFLISRADSLNYLLASLSGDSVPSIKLKNQLAQLQFKMSYFLFIYKDSGDRENEHQDGRSDLSNAKKIGLSWSIIDTNKKEPRILLSLPSQMLEWTDYPDSDRVTTNIKSFLFELRRQLIHEFYVRHDAGQLIGNGMSDLDSRAKGITTNYSCRTHAFFSTGLNISHSRQVSGEVIKKILVNYRAAQFESILGFGPRLKSFSSLKEIIEKYDEQPILPLTVNFTEASIDLIFKQLQSSLSVDGRGLGCPNGTTTITTQDTCDRQLEPLLKASLVFGENQPQYTSGPGCVSCGSGWNTDDSRGENP